MDKQLWRVVAWLLAAAVIFTSVMVLTAKAASSSATIYYTKHIGRWGIDYAARAWTAHGDATFQRVRSCEGLDPCINIYPSDDLPPDWMAATYINSQDQWIEVNIDHTDEPRRYKRETMCHEFGHVLGYQHADGSCMEAYNTGRYLTP